MKNFLLITTLIVCSLSAFAKPVCGTVYTGDTANEVLFAIDYLADAPALDVRVIMPKCRCSESTHAQIKFDLFKKLASYSDDIEILGHKEMKVCVENASVDLKESELVINSSSKITIK